MTLLKLRACERCVRIMDQKVMIWAQRHGISTKSSPVASWISIGPFKQPETSIRRPLTESPRRLLCVEAKASAEKSTPQNQISEKVEKAKEGAVWGMLIGDATGMPVHWFYKTDDIKTYYDGWLTGYEAPGKHPSSIMCVTPDDEIQNDGWYSKGKPVSIINLMLGDKAKYWLERDSSLHYHHGMEAGDNTMNAVLALHLLSTMDSLDGDRVKEARHVQGKVLQHYLQFLTTPNQHKDTYIPYCHRAFVKDWASFKTKLTGWNRFREFCHKRYSINMRNNKEDSRFLDIGALTMAIPLIVWNANNSVDECSIQAVDFIRCTHPIKGMEIYVDAYARLLHGVLNGSDLQKGVLETTSHLESKGPSKQDRILILLEKAQSLPKGSEERLRICQNAVQRLWSNPAIDGAISSMLLLAYEFADDLEDGVLTNANCGGDTCNRGAPLGALLGAQAMNIKKEIPKHLMKNLNAGEEVIEWSTTQQR